MGNRAMRAKMMVSNVDDSFDGQEQLNFSAVCKAEGYDENGSDENNTFAKFTPCAELSMTVMNPALFGQFKVGDEFYVDFIACEQRDDSEDDEGCDQQADCESEDTTQAGAEEASSDG